jgi:hypothetical protein
VQRKSGIERAARDVNSGDHGLAEKAQSEPNEGDWPHAACVWWKQSQARPGRCQSCHGSGSEIGSTASGEYHPEDQEA